MKYALDHLEVFYMAISLPVEVGILVMMYRLHSLLAKIYFGGLLYKG